MENNLIPMDTSPVSLFQKDRLEPFLAKVKRAVDDFVPDIKTAKGRKEVAAFAYKISQTKTIIEKAGKALVFKQKAEIKLTDNDRKRSRDFLDEQRDRARLPLTEWEEAEKKLIAEEAAKIEFEADHTEALEFHALWLKEKELEALKVEIARAEEEKREKEEYDQKLAVQKAREERLKKEAAEQAKKDAEEAIRKAEETAKQAERDRIAAEERAVFEKEEAVRQEKLRAKVEARRLENERLEKDAEEKATKERKARHYAHRKKIEREVAEDLERTIYIVNNETPESIAADAAQLIIKKIASGKIRHIFINY